MAIFPSFFKSACGNLVNNHAYYGSGSRQVLRDRCPSYLTAGQAGQHGIPQHQVVPVFGWGCRMCDLNMERDKEHESRKQEQHACPEAAVKTGREGRREGEPGGN